MEVSGAVEFARLPWVPLHSDGNGNGNNLSRVRMNGSVVVLEISHLVIFVHVSCFVDVFWLPSACL